MSAGAPLPSGEDPKRRLRAVERMLAVRRAHDDLIAFTQLTMPDPKDPDNPGASRYDAQYFHRALAAALQEVETGAIKRLIITFPPRHGKALAVDTPIATPSGWSRIGDLRPGDLVFGANGRPTPVVAVSPVWRDRPVFRVITDDGDEILADAEHEWPVRLDRGYPVVRNKTTAVLAARTSTRNPMVQAAGPLALPVAELPVDPYVLGLWLGDGRTNSASITSADQEIIDELERLEGADGSHYARVGATMHYRPGPSYRSGATKAETLQGRLRALGVLGDKHLPVAYLRASQEQRLHLLQGLIDSDGYVAPTGQIEFCSTRLELAEGVREIVNSLGAKASLLAGRAMLYGKDCGPRYRVSFYLANAARLPRKAVKCRDAGKCRGRYLVFEPAGTADTVCIEVAAADHLFLCGRSMTPTHNSELTSKRFLAWFVGRDPYRHVALGTYNETFAEDYGRDVKAIMNSAAYAQVFPGVALRKDSQAAGRMNTEAGGALYFVGRGGSITGRGAHLIVIDDPIKNSEEADSPRVRDEVWTWFNRDIMSRFMDDEGRAIVIQCMVGDTAVRMADGSEMPLRDVRTGDAVATYVDGEVGVSTVLNWASQGVDDVFEITTQSGAKTKANGRHPFLIERNGNREWVRLTGLRVGDNILRATGIEAPISPMAPGKASLAGTRAATPPRNARGSATPTTTRIGGPGGTDRQASTRGPAAPRICVTDTASALRSTTLSSQSRAAGAPCASSPPAETCVRTGAGSSASTTITEPGRFAPCSATTATSPSDMEKPPMFCGAPQNTWSIIRDPIAEIAAAGREEVFDIQVAVTENFIADGFVSHNTRWHEDDLVGRITDPKNPHYKADEAAEWKVINIPAIAEDNDILGREAGTPLWPTKFGLTYLLGQKRRDARAFNALYQQRPTAEDGEFFKAEHISTYLPHERPPRAELRVYMASDHAVAEKQHNDRTCILVCGLDRNDNIWVLDCYWKRADTEVVVEKLIDLIVEWKPMYWWAEDDHIVKSIGPFLKKRMKERKVYLGHSKVPGYVDKQKKAQAIKGRMSMGMVYFPKTATWFEDARDEILKFPRGVHDDFVDALSSIGRGLGLMFAPPKPPEQQTGPKVGSFGWLKTQSKATARAERVKVNMASL